MQQSFAKMTVCKLRLHMNTRRNERTDNQSMLTTHKKQYLILAQSHTEPEIAQILKLNPRTIRRYAIELGIRPQPTKFTNKPLTEWIQRFDSIYHGQITIKTDIHRDNRGHIKATCVCSRCKKEWTADINEKIRNKTGCKFCDKGKHGNAYSVDEVEQMLNRIYTGQWSLIKYEHYSRKDSIIRCNLCGTERYVDLSSFINTTMRCTKCQTGSFGEYVIANVLRYNDISFEKEKIIIIDNHRYRLDFLINNRIALEYSGLQHFEKGLYYNEAINNGVKLK